MVGEEEPSVASADKWRVEWELELLQNQLSLAKERASKLAEQLRAAKKKAHSADDLKRKLQVAEEKRTQLETLEATLECCEKELPTEVTKLQSELATAWEGKAQAEEDAAEENEAGFDRAMAQVKLLYPDLDLSAIGFGKDIVDRRLVDIW